MRDRRPAPKYPDQGQILRALASVPGDIDLSGLCKMLGVAPSAKEARHQVIAKLGHLMGVSKKMVRRTGRPGFKNNPEPRYAATDAGRAFVRDGKTFKPGWFGAHRPRVKANTHYARVWAALRLSRKATIPELIERAARPGDSVVVLQTQACALLQKLRAAGVVVRLSKREPGHAPSSPGFWRYALVKDLGPIVPTLRPSSIYDHNSRTEITWSKKP